ncbi:MAG: mechanosensitive ion channel [Thermodesulfobacteria bacterium]|nr:mechanosensitive ion channel [Thermodesulfobacteriota bacterium]
MKRLLITFFILICWCGTGFSQSLPIPTKTKDPRYFEKDPAKRKAFFEEQEKLLRQIEARLKELKPQNPEEKKIIKEAEELLSTLPLLWQKIELELAQKPETEPLNLPPLKKPPYSIEDFRRLLSLGFQLQHELEALRGKIRLEEQELERLEKALEEIYRDYLLLAEEKAGPETYLRLAEFLNLQARWALAKIRLDRSNERLKQLVDLKTRYETLVHRVFAGLKATPKDIEPFEKAVKKAQQELELLQQKNQKLREKAERDLALLEIRLAKLGNGKSTLVALKGKYYETRRENIETRLQELDEAENLASLKVEHLTLWLDFVSCLAKCPRHHVFETIEKYQERLEQLEDQKENTKYRLDYLQEKIIIVKSNLALHKDELKRATKKQESYYLKLLIKEEQDLLKNLEDLQGLLQKELELLKRFTFEGNTIITLWKAKISFLTKALNRLKKFYQRSENTIKSILYYPLWKSGETSFTVLSFLKIVLVLAIGIILLKLIRRKIERFLIQRLGMAPGVVNSLSTLSYYIMLCLLALVALSSAGINMSQIALIFGALSVGIGFGLQTIANNFVSGIILLTERSIKVGDLVQFEDGTIGVVKKINIRSTVIRTFDALEIIVPNSEFISQRISTWTYDDDWRRILIPFGVAYGTDPEKVKEVAIKAARTVPITREDRDHPVRVRFVGFGDSSLNFELAVWIRQSEVNRAMTGIKSDYYYALYKALNEAGIEIPFPQRDIHLRSIYPEAAQELRRAFEEGSCE